ncbi:hypothetical protein V1517DRAFT_310691 [Lipomyces orientalis]|uniref:Uncharacterized protein n=1 Tax=Lipomyces orientalis TaxID=1233043 RepID=A0ACC3TFD2_9ASCO
MDEKEILEATPQSIFKKEAHPTTTLLPTVSTDRASFQAKAEDNDVEIAVSSTDHNKQSSQQEKDANIMDRYGLDGPEMAVNWPTKRKWAIILLLSTLTLLTPFASSMFAPSVSEVMEDFHSTNVDLGSFVVSVYLVGVMHLAHSSSRR